MAKVKTFRKLTDNKGDDAVKLAPQEQVIFDSIPKSKAGLKRDALIEKLTELASGDEPKLVTRQSPASILGYYTKHLVDSGLIEVEVTETEPEKKEEPKAA
jgi:hypothetical protein